MSRLHVTLQQATHIGAAARSDFVRTTLTHIPGWTIRGAMAAAWIDANGVPSTSHPLRDRFVRLFEGGVRFGPLHSEEPPVSLAVVGHKHGAGRDCKKVEIDTAVDQAPERCPDCHQRYQQMRGERPIRRIQVSRRPGLQVSDTGTAVDGQLFLIESVPPGSVFQGDILGDPEDVRELAALTALRIGGRRVTRGWAGFTVSEHSEPAVPERVGKDRLVIRLASPAVFVDDVGRPVPQPSDAELSGALGVDVQVVRSWYRWEQHGGWHAASGLPKPVETAVAAGSTYVCRITGRPADEALSGLARRGIGLRRHEGFGHLAGPTHLTWPRERRDQLAQSWQAAMIDAATPTGFLDALTQVAQGNAAVSTLHPFVEAVMADPIGGAKIRRLAATPPAELRRHLLEGDTR